MIWAWAVIAICSVGLGILGYVNLQNEIHYGVEDEWPA